MKTIKKSTLIWYSPAQMCDLVSDIARYPEFLPWCAYTTVSDTKADGSYTAEIGMQIASVRQGFTTRNRRTGDASLQLSLVDGPFNRLEGFWRFLPLAQEANACRIELDLDYDLHPFFALMVGALFDKIADNLMQAFVTRAEKIYG